MSRSALQNIIESIPKSAPLMEIGPLTNPFLQKDKFNVYYADVRTTEELCAFYNYDPNINVHEIAKIDIVTGLYDTYTQAILNANLGFDKFDAVFSSHVIEHTYDFIRHLQEINDVLKDNALYLLCVPDKRYTFDYFRAVTPFRDAYDIYSGGKLSRLRGDFILNSTSNNYPEKALFPITRILDLKVFEDDFHDAHYWVFTDVSFLEIIRDCLRFGLISFGVSEFFPRIQGIEFQIVLKKLSNTDVVSTEVWKIQRIIDGLNGADIVYKKIAQKLREFIYINRYSPLYIYGGGYHAAIVYEALRYLQSVNVCAIIVSDDFEKRCDFTNNIAVKHLSEIDDYCAIVIAVNPNAIEEVRSNILKRGFNDAVLCDLQEIFSKIQEE